MNIKTAELCLRLLKRGYERQLGKDGTFATENKMNAVTRPDYSYELLSLLCDDDATLMRRISETRELWYNNSKSAEDPAIKAVYVLWCTVLDDLKKVILENDL